jgi:di/tricarboxylate transporter
MPLAFATILGGMTTLIGTPPNIIASAIRAERLGEPYSMFDFSPVGGAVAILGLVFVATIGWRLVPRRKDQPAEIDPASFVAEVVVPEDSKLVGSVGAELDQPAEDADVRLLGLIRDRKRHGGFWAMAIQSGDILLVEGATDGIASFIKAANLQKKEAEDDHSGAVEDSKSDVEGQEDEEPGGPEVVEAVVKADSPLVGWSAASIGLRPRFGITLLGIARAGRLTREEIGQRVIDGGDDLLISGNAAGSQSMLDELGLVAINRVNIAPFKPINAALAVLLFVGAIAVGTLGYLSFPVAIAIAIVAYAGLGLVPAREFYTQIEWPVVVMLACLLPLGMAFERVGGTSLIANGIADVAQGYSPIVALLIIMIVTMTLSDVLNNVATIVITGPIAIDLANRLDSNPDTFLMGTAIAASCAFLTPIGHKNNTLIMGPGGFRFSDYWRMGLPLEIVVLAVSVPALVFFWGV